MVYGVASWHGNALDFTDGLCHACAARARAEMGFPEPGSGSTAARRALAIGAALMFLLAPDVLEQFPPGVFPVPSALRPVVRSALMPSALIPAAFSVREAAAAEAPPQADIRAILALLTAAASAVDGPVAAPPPARVSRHRPDRDRLVPPTRAQLRLYDDPASPLALFSVQTP